MLSGKNLFPCDENMVFLGNISPNIEPVIVIFFWLQASATLPGKCKQKEEMY